MAWRSAPATTVKLADPCLLGVISVGQPDGRRVDVMHSPTEVERKILLDIGRQFFQGEISTAMGASTRLDQCLIFSGLPEQKMIDAVHK